MFAITGITGQVGGHVARALLDAGRKVRAVVREPGRGASWAARDCEVAVARMDDAAALQRAFTGVEGVFVLLPPHFDPSTDFREARAEIEALRAALGAAQPARIVCLSTIGAQATEPNVLNQLGLLEKGLGTLSIPTAFLRAAWFMENSAWDIEPARRDGIVPGYLQPADKPVPMVATADVGRLAAQLLMEDWQGQRIVEIEGPRRVTPNEIATCLARLLERDVATEPVPRETWESVFRSQGMKNPSPRARMIDGFNAGWIEFEQGGTRSRKGSTTLETVLEELVASRS